MRTREEIEKEWKIATDLWCQLPRSYGNVRDQFDLMDTQHRILKDLLLDIRELLQEKKK